MKLKKFLSFTLALVMALSLLPVMALAADSAPKTLTYEFSATAANITAGSSPTEGNSYGNWVFAGGRRVDGTKMQALGTRYRILNSSNDYLNANCFAIKVTIPEDYTGTYKPTFTFAPIASGVTLSIYTVEATQEVEDRINAAGSYSDKTAISGAELIASYFSKGKFSNTAINALLTDVDTSKEGITGVDTFNKDNFDSKEGNAVAFEAGKSYYIGLVVSAYPGSGVQESSHYWCRPVSLVLEKQPDPISWRTASLSLEHVVATNYYIDPNASALDAAGFQLSTDTAYLELRSSEDLQETPKKIPFTVNTERYGEPVWLASVPVPAKEMADTQYVRACVIVNGEPFYTEVKSYSPQQYAKNKLANEATNEANKKLVVSLMDYGAKAQTKFSYKAASLMNAFIDENTAYSALRVTYVESMLTDCRNNDKTKFQQSEDAGITNISASLELEGAVNINVKYDVTAALLEGCQQASLLYWNQETYNAAATLTAENAVAVDITKVSGSENRYYGQITGIAAKDLEDAYYTCFYIKDKDGVEHYGKLICYSAHQYAIKKITANGDTALTELCQAMAVYSSNAKAVLG